MREPNFYLALLKASYNNCIRKKSRKEKEKEREKKEKRKQQRKKLAEAFKGKKDKKGNKGKKGKKEENVQIGAYTVANEVDQSQR